MVTGLIGDRDVLRDFLPALQQTAGQATTVIQQGRRAHHGQDHDGDQQPRLVRGKELMGDPQCNQHKTELPCLGENQAASHCGIAAFFQQAQQCEYQQTLEQHQGGGGNNDPVPLIGKQVRVHQHADTDKEQPQQQIPERAKIGFDLVTEVALAQHHAGQKRPQSHGQPQPVSHPRGQQCQQQGGHDEDFIRAGPTGFFQHARQHPAADHIDTGKQ